MLFSTCLVDCDNRRLSLELIQQVWSQQDGTDVRERAIAAWAELQRLKNARVADDYFMIQNQDDIYDAIVLHSLDLLPVCGKAEKNIGGV